MLLNYLKLALRLLIRNPFFTFINVFGLSVGFATFFILWPFAQSELKTDQFMKDHERISRILVELRWTDNGGESWGQVTLPYAPANIGSELSGNQTEVLESTRYIDRSIFNRENSGLKSELVFAFDDSAQESFFTEDRVICADSNFFEFFNISFIEGNRETALKNSRSVVISEKISQRYFGKNKPLSRMLKINGEPYLVTGVFTDLPKNSHLDLDIVISNVASLNVWNEQIPGRPWAYIYVRTKEPSHQIAEFLNKQQNHYMGEFLKRSPHIRVNFLTESLKEIAFSENFYGDTNRSKSKFILTLLLVVSVLVLLMAWMNYVNMTLSQTKSRFKEIAARKVSGAGMRNIFSQFIIQSLLINLLAALLGITVIQLVRQPFADVLHIYVISVNNLDPFAVMVFLGIFSAGILVTAMYPTIAVMQYTSKQLVNKEVLIQKRMLPSVLTTVQYAAAIVLIAWIFIIYFQLDFILNKDIGLNKDQVITFDAPIVLPEQGRQNLLMGYLKKIRQHPSVENAALSYAGIGDKNYANISIRRVGQEEWFGTDSHGGIDENFIPLHDIKIIAGRNFLSDELADAVILSKYSTERLGYKNVQEAIGRRIQVLRNTDWHEVEIIGVIADYRVLPYINIQNNSENITGRGECFTYMDHIFSWQKSQRFSIRIKGNPGDLIPALEKTFTENFPGNIFRWYFLEDHIKQHYDQFKVSRNQLLFFTLLALGVACLGLLGMITNKVVEKTKEIGIRKVLGANLLHISTILLSTTARHLIIAVLIGIPIAWQLSIEYLSRFVDQIPLRWWHFGLPVFILIVIMFVTIGFTLLRAARSNPVEALKYE